MTIFGIHSASFMAAVWLVCLSATACLPAPANQRAVLHPKSTIVSGSELESSLRLLYHCGAVPSTSPSGVWTPSPLQAAEVDGAVRSALTRALSIGRIAGSDDYYIQYFGLVMGRRQVIFVNGVHEVAARGYLPSRWHSTPMVICDLGRAGFRSEYEVDTGRLGELRFAEEYPPTT